MEEHSIQDDDDDDDDADDDDDDLRESYLRLSKEKNKEIKGFQEKEGAEMLVMLTFLLGPVVWTGEITYKRSIRNKIYKIYKKSL